MQGFGAYRVFVAMSTHFRRNGYDGWKYDFKTRSLDVKTFATKKNLIYQFAAIERDCPNRTELLKYYFPAFMEQGYVGLTQARIVHTKYRDFTKRLETLEERYTGFLAWLFKNIDNIEDILDVSDDIPKIYQLFQRGEPDYDVTLLFFTIFRELNTIVSRDAIVFGPWRERILFDQKFFVLYFTQCQIKALKLLTVDKFNEIKRQSR